MLLEISTLLRLLFLPKLTDLSMTFCVKSNVVISLLIAVKSINWGTPERSKDVKLLSEINKFVIL